VQESRHRSELPVTALPVPTRDEVHRDRVNSTPLSSYEIAFFSKLMVGTAMFPFSLDNREHCRGDERKCRIYSNWPNWR
jgi:hypothetical protein